MVVAIIGLLSSVVFASLNSARSKGRDAKRMSEMRQLKTALESYYNKNGSYPASGWVRSCDTAWNTVLGAALVEFLPKMPIDPTNNCTGTAFQGHTYSYFAINYQGTSGPGQWYMIVYTLENKNLSLDSSNKATACSNQLFDYGGNDGYIITVGGSCVK